MWNINVGIVKSRVWMIIQRSEYAGCVRIFSRDLIRCSAFERRVAPNELEEQWTSRAASIQTCEACFNRSNITIVLDQSFGDSGEGDRRKSILVISMLYRHRHRDRYKYDVHVSRKKPAFPASLRFLWPLGKRSSHMYTTLALRVDLPRRSTFSASACETNGNVTCGLWGIC